MRRVVILAAITAVVGACSTTPPPVPTVDLTVDCAPLDEITPTTWPLPRVDGRPYTPNAARFEHVGRCLIDDGEAVAAAVIDIGERHGGRILLTTWTDQHGFVPALTARTYDPDGNLVGVHPFDTFVQRGTRYTATLFVRENQPVRYLVLIPDSELSGTSRTHIAGHTETHSMYTPTTGSMVITTGGERPREMRFVTGGWFSITTAD